jgi:ubiquinol-cytochrome c reductase iron-sulfur subunit
LNQIAEGEGIKLLWRGTPIWVIRRSSHVISQLSTLSSDLKDPDSSNAEQPLYIRGASRSVRADIMVLTAICTHLGCVPDLKSVGDSALGATILSGFVCPCHGSRFDAAGRVLKGSPAPANLAIPPHHFMGDSVLVIGVDS